MEAVGTSYGEGRHHGTNARVWQRRPFLCPLLPPHPNTVYVQYHSVRSLRIFVFLRYASVGELLTIVALLFDDDTQIVVGVSGRQTPPGLRSC